MSGTPDYALEATIDFKFTSRAFATGIPTVLAGSPVVVVYEDNGTTEITVAETLTVDFDTIVGLNNLRIVATAANGFEAGKSYSAVLSAGTVGGVSVVGEVVAQFSLQRCPVNWANVTAPTTAVDLSATDIQLCDTTTTNTDVRGTDSAATAASLATAQLDLDTITGADGVNLLSATQASVDAIETDTTTDIPALIATAQADLDIVTGADGVNLLSATQTSVDAIETDTEAMQPLIAKVPLSDGAISWNATALGAINAECDTAISDAALATAADLLDKLGAVNEAAAAGDPSATESVMQYVKQIVNVLTGTTGITTILAAAAPGNNVSIAEMVRSIYDDTNELQGDWVDAGRLDTLLDAIPTTAMRGTDSAALASVATEARLAELDAANLPTDIAAIPTTAMRGTDSAALASDCWSDSTPPAGTAMSRAVDGIVLGTASGTPTTTSIPTSSLVPAAAAADQFQGRVVTFDDATTTAELRGQTTDITSNTSGGVLTVTALTTAPVSGDTFTIQ